jgi:3D (Asp-Asp-Asp) domain-containing protein
MAMPTPPPVEEYVETTPHVVLPDSPKFERLDNVLLTHYCICEKCCGKTPDHPAYGITASGREAEPYVSIAVDPEIIPLGTIVWLEYSDGQVVRCRADDTGNAIKDARIDLCVSSHSEALELGIEYISVIWEVKEDVLQ